MIRSTLKKILALATGKKAEPPRPTPAPPPRRPPPRVLDDEDEGDGGGHNHSHGHSHSHGHAHDHAEAPAPTSPAASAITVSPEQTPNPNAMKFTVNRKVSAKGSFSFNSPAEATASPLGKALFGISGVVGVFGVNDFVTVTKDDATSWDQLLAPISEALKASL